MSQENEKIIVIPDGIKKFLPEELKNININLNNVDESKKNIKQLTSELRKLFFSNKEVQISADELLKLIKSILAPKIDLNDEIVDDILNILKIAIINKAITQDYSESILDILKTICVSKRITDSEVHSIFDSPLVNPFLLNINNQSNPSSKTSFIKGFLELIESVLTSEVDLRKETVDEIFWRLRRFYLDKISTPDEISKFLDVLQSICTHKKMSDNTIHNIFHDQLFYWPNPETIKMQDFPMKKFFSLIQNILSTKSNLSEETVTKIFYKLNETIYWQKTDIKLVLTEFKAICENAKSSQQADTIINEAFRGLSGLMGQYKFEIKYVLSMIEEILKSNVVLEGKTVEYILRFVLEIVETQQLQECDLTSIFTLLERTFDKNHKVKGDDIFWIFHQLNRLITNRKICFVQPPNSSATAISSLVDKILESNLEMKDDARENIMLVLLTAIKQKGLLKFYDLKSLVEVIKQNGCNNDNSLTSNNLENIFNALISSIKIGVGDSDKLPIAMLEKICNEEENKLTSAKVCCLFDILFELANNPDQMEIYAFSSKEVLTLLQKFLNFDIQLGFNELHTLGCIFGSLLEKMKTGKHIFKCEDVFGMLQKVYQANNDKLTWEKVSKMLDVLWCFIGKPNEYNVEANILKENLLNLIKEVLDPNVPFYCSCSDDIFLNILPKAIENKIYDVDVVIQMFNDVCNSDNGQFDSDKIDGIIYFISDKVVKQWDKDKTKNFPTDNVLTLAKKILKIETKPYGFRLKSVFETLFLIAKMGDEEKNKIAKMLNDLGMYFEPQDETFVITKIDNSKLKNFVSEKRIAEISKIYKIDDVKQKEQEKKVENEVKTENKSQNQGKLQVNINIADNDNIHNMNNENSDKDKKKETESREIESGNNIQNLNDDSNNPIKNREKEDNSNSNENENENSNADEESNKKSIDKYFKAYGYDSIKILNHLKFDTTNLKQCFKCTNNQISKFDRVKASLKIWFYMLFHYPLILFFDKNYSLGFHRDFDICCKQSQKEMSLKCFTFKNDEQKSVLELIKAFGTQQKIKNDNRQSRSEYKKDEQKQ